MTTRALDRPDERVFRAIGQPLRRKEDGRLLTGQGRFSDDATMPGQAYAALVRSTLPHARLGAIATRRARAMPGVLGVFTGADAQADGLGPLPHTPVPQTKYDLTLTAPGGGAIFIGPHLLLPVDKVRHVGEAVAMVVAETADQALDAAEAVEVAYAPLPWVLDAAAALAHGAPAVWDAVPNNLLVDTEFGDEAATTRAFAAAAHMIDFEYHIGRVTAVALEPRAALAHHDAGTGRYTLHAGSGGAVRQKRELAGALGIQPEQLRVLSHDVGGNFGSKNRPYVEYGLVLWAARQVGRPVKFTASRAEAFLSDYQGRDLVTTLQLALDAAGRFLALRAHNISNVGARCVSLSPLGKGEALITGAYDIPAAHLRAQAVFTNTMSTQAYRSSGRPEVTFAIERLIDRAAAALGVDPLALRRRNLVRADAMPYTNAVGARYDSGDYEANMNRAMRLADWDGYAARRRAAAARGMRLGRSLANYVESSIGAPRERVEITVTAEDRVDLVVGTQPSGQGHETSFAQVAADLLWVPVEAINVITGDTDVVSVGGGSHSGRSLRHAATVMAKAAPELIARGKRIAASVFDAPVDQIGFVDGRFSAPHSNRSFSVLELAKEAARRALPAELASGLAVAAENEMHDPVYPNGCAVSEVEVDPETGAVALTRYAAVDDVGRCINPLIVHGQTHGAIAQGVGQALSELCALDRGSGQPLAGSLLDYALPRADTLPALDTEIVEVLSPTNPLGIKAGGEGGTTPALAAVIGAIVDALADLGVRDLAMPATPLAVWQAIQAARRR
ncbi:MAG: xanthine dehydrogenase family protein molybdopterin-binding subunit [Proteobacteria bacterium]|nr:xanthine dehydrogenase family protein molybdopterin-binding subunit [Pseudomonadota bacterium]